MSLLPDDPVMRTALAESTLKLRISLSDSPVLVRLMSDVRYQTVSAGTGNESCIIRFGESKLVSTPADVALCDDAPFVDLLTGRSSDPPSACQCRENRHAQRAGSWKLGCQSGLTRSVADARLFVRIHRYCGVMRLKGHISQGLERHCRGMVVDK